MKLIQPFSCLSVAVLAFAACAAPKNYRRSVLPRADGVVVTTTAATETDALDGCKREAIEHCGKRSFVVVEGPESSYHGPDKSGTTGVAGQVVSGLFGGSRDKSEDYKARMVFNCQ